MNKLCISILFGEIGHGPISVACLEVDLYMLLPARVKLYETFQGVVDESEECVTLRAVSDKNRR